MKDSRRNMNQTLTLTPNNDVIGGKRWRFISVEAHRLYSFSTNKAALQHNNCVWMYDIYKLVVWMYAI